MPSNNSKYSEETRESTAKFILEKGRSATSVAEELGIDTNTVCRWVRDYRRKNKMPTYAEEKGISIPRAKSDKELAIRVKELEKETRNKDRIIEEEREKVEILKKSLHIFMQPHE